MASVSTNDLKNGMTLNLPEGLFSVVEFQHVKPGKGGAFVRTKLKNIRSGSVIDRTYRADEKLDQAIIDKKEMQFLYTDGGAYVFMDNTDYEQLTSPREALGTAANFLKEGDSALLQFYDGEIIGVDLPAAVELTVTQTEPGVQGDRVSGARKPATLETGITRAGPAFRQHRGQGQGRHPQRRVPDARRELGLFGLGGRRGARERALELLYESDLKDQAVSGVLEELPVPPQPYATMLAMGVEDHRARIDELISSHAIDWSLDRMPVIDRAVLRMATFELGWRPDVPTSVVISEAVELAK